MSEENTPTLEKRLEELEAVQTKVLQTLQSVTGVVTELRQKAENTQLILSSVLRTIADGRPLVPEQLRESHHLLVSDKVNKIFNNAVNASIIESIDTVQEDSIVIVQEFDANGTELHRASEFSMSNIDEDFKTLFRDKPIGERVALFKDGQLVNTFIVQSIFKPLDKVEKEFNAEDTSIQTEPTNQETVSEDPVSP